MFGLFRKKQPQEAQTEEEPKALPEPSSTPSESAEDKVLKDAVEAMLVEQASAEVEAPAPSAPEPGPATNVIGADMHIAGSLASTSAIVVLGEIEGNVAGTAVTVEEDGAIKGDIAATADVTIRGSVVGNLGVDGKLTISPTGRVEGGVEARAIAIDEGGELRGRCMMRASGR
ncbi:MAG: polymer-forming cytoskeletal protein [Nannocystaceae bacterium]|nr:polymer-forming cytoskeletal protein [bacterium]